MSLQTFGKKAPTSLDSLGATVFSGVSASSASRLCKRSRICFADVRQPRLPRTSSKRGPDGLQALWPRPVVEKVKKVTELRTSLWFICSDFWAKPEPIWGPIYHANRRCVRHPAGDRIQRSHLWSLHGSIQCGELKPRISETIRASSKRPARSCVDEVLHLLSGSWRGHGWGHKA